MLEFLKLGWPIIRINIKKLNKEPDNHAGPKLYPKATRDYLKQEIQLGSVLDLFITNPYDDYIHISPFNTREKPDTMERRIIADHQTA